MPMRRLTKQEYLNTLRDLVGASGLSVTDPTLPGDELEESGYSWGADIDTNALQGLMTFAHGVAASVEIGSVFTCAPGAVERDCVSTWLDAFGRRAYRRPLSSAEKAELQADFDAARSGLSMNLTDSVRLLVETIIQSPYVLYLWELGPAPATVDKVTQLIALDDYEVASRLSYALWQSMPDDALLVAAASHALTSSAGALEGQARRMLKDAKARDAIGNLHLQWLEIPEKMPPRMVGATALDQATFTAIRDETAAFAASVVLDKDAQLSTLLNSNVAFVNQYTAPLYGLSQIAADAGTALQEVTLPATERAGILTRLAYQLVNSDTAESKPPARGKYVLEQLLCTTPPPPPKVVPVLPPPDPSQTTRQRYEAHDTLACASGCHRLFDPIGYAFENFDWVGRYRSNYTGGQEVDAAASISLTTSPPLSGHWSDFHGLGVWLAESSNAQDCTSRNYFRYLVGRVESTDADKTSWDAASRAFAASGHNLRELIVAIVTTTSFTHRQPNPGEVTQ